MSEIEKLQNQLEKNLEVFKNVRKISEMLSEAQKIEADFKAGSLTSEEEIREKVDKLASFIVEIKKMPIIDEKLTCLQMIEKSQNATRATMNSASEYYTQNIDELINDIKENIKQSIYTVSTLHSEDSPEWETVEKINRNILQFHMGLLQRIAPERNQEILDFFEYAFSNTDKIIKKIKEKRYQPEESTSELGLYVANPLAIMFNGKATSALGQARTIGKIDEQRKKLMVGNVSIFFKRFKDVSKLGVGEQKILRYIIAAFTEKNSHGTQNPQLRQRLFLSLNDYAKVTGTEIDTEDRLKNFKKKLKKNLDNLKEDTTFSWTEKINGKDRMYANVSFISGYKITKDTITIEFSLSAAEYLVSLNTLIQYPRSLYAVDDRDYNAFAIGEAMSLHYSQYNNVIRGTEQMLSVIKLLEVTSFPSYETLKNKRWGWERNIKEPLEKALDHLYQCGFLKDWSYSKTKGIKLTNEEAGQITSYEKFMSLYIWYELKDYPEHRERADAIIEAKIKNIEKTKQKRPKNKKG